MSKGRRKSPPKSWQTDRHARRQTFTKIYSNMLTSPAWLDLTKRQRLLYLICRDREMYPHPQETNTPADDQLFYMNRELYVNTYKLYRDNRRDCFYSDMRALVDHGFISVYRSGKNNRVKSIYMYSDKWKSWTKETTAKRSGTDKKFIWLSPKSEQPLSPKSEQDRVKNRASCPPKVNKIGAKTAVILSPKSEQDI